MSNRAKIRELAQENDDLRERVAELEAVLKQTCRTIPNAATRKIIHNALAAKEADDAS